nr:MAG TPA: hypothetical protein [Caudoviricetes sp.]
MCLISIRSKVKPNQEKNLHKIFMSFKSTLNLGVFLL